MSCMGTPSKCIAADTLTAHIGGCTRQGLLLLRCRTLLHDEWMPCVPLIQLLTSSVTVSKWEVAS